MIILALAIVTLLGLWLLWLIVAEPIGLNSWLRSVRRRRHRR